MLTAAQLASLQEVIRHVSPDVQLEAATMDAQGLELVLCRDLMCFQPLRISPQEVDIAAALAGDPIALRALQYHLRTLLQKFLP